MPEQRAPTMLCLASYFKGEEFLRECKRQACYVILLTVDSLAEADWPHESIDELCTLPDLADRQEVIRFVSRLARDRQIDRIVALEDYDVEVAATLREHMRCPGMGDTTARYFRDKLAMRVQARDKGIAVPDFVAVLNYDQVRDFTERVSPPWVLKPRAEAAAVGIRKIHGPDDLWPALDELGDRQCFYLLEQFIPGDVYHVDAITSERAVVFSEAHKYGTPPLNVAHEGGIFTTRTLPRWGPETRTLQAMHREVLGALGFVRGVTHTEFIRGHNDNRFYFLETAARAAGAYIVDLVEASTGVNLWAEWARLEIAGGDRPYSPPNHRLDYAGIIISLARQEHPDTSAYQDPEITWRLDRLHHAGLIITSRDPERVRTLLDSYTARFYEDFFATEPLPDKPVS
ncbi:MAG: acetyl-CoA carboxylase biotin carboxylase subunit family protein [Chloroflexia bacterium]